MGYIIFSVKYEMCNKVLSLHFIPPFEQAFFGEYQQDFISLILTLYGINVCYYVYIFWSIIKN